MKPSNKDMAVTFSYSFTSNLHYMHTVKQKHAPSTDKSHHEHCHDAQRDRCTLHRTQPFTVSQTRTNTLPCPVTTDFKVIYLLQASRVLHTNLFVGCIPQVNMRAEHAINKGVWHWLSEKHAPAVNSARPQ